MSRLNRGDLAIGLAWIALVLTGCSCSQEAEPEEAEASADEEAAAAVDNGPPDAGHDEGPPRPPARIFARRFVSKVRERPDRESFRIGYLRAGAVVQATTGNPVRSDDPRCRGGWYELTTGGFVCNGREFTAFWGRRPPEVRGAQPDREAPLPYVYGRNLVENAPMYQRLPTDEDAAEFEGFRIPAPPGEETDEEGADARSETGGEREAVAAAPTDAPAEATAAEEPPAPAAAPTPTAAPAPTETAAAAPQAPSSGEGGGPSADPTAEEEEEMVTLEALAGDPDSVLRRRMMRGFIVSLDRDFRAGDYRRRYWRTINNGFVPYRSVREVRAPSFQGFPVIAALTGETEAEETAEAEDGPLQLPVGFTRRRRANRYVMNDAGDRVRRQGASGFRTRFAITGTFTQGDTDYWLGEDGVAYRQRDVTVIETTERPDEVGQTDKWIDVDLTRQTLVAYEGDTPVYATLISSGKAPRTPEDEDYLTPAGVFRIRAKHVAATMDGDSASDGPYSIDDVPYVMYFQLAYALHSAFWHNGFGIPRSHGCVNLAPLDARFIFDWSDPQVPEGWHGAYPTDEGPGTWIYIHGETPGT